MTKNKKKKAAAIKYLKEDLDTPVIAALGSGKIADKIIKQALKNGIDIVEDKEFFKYEELFAIEEKIPAEVYQIIINILVSIIKTNRGKLNEEKDIN